jgi:hypothetical protein
VQRSAISHSRLMRESTDRIESALRSEDDKDHHIAHRLLETTRSFHSWELEHSGLMRQVAEQGKLQTQALALRHAALRLIHGKALFEYLRTNKVRGEQRVQILSYFHPTRLYEYAVVQEHGSYLRKAGSFLCTSHLGADLVSDPVFLDPMQHYEGLYGEYFNLYCSTLFPRDGSIESASVRSLLPLLKHQLNEWRYVILNPRAGMPKLRRESETRAPAGDTQRLPMLRVANQGR